MLFALLIATGATPPAKPQFSNNRIPDADVVATMEKMAVMPAGARPLAKYDRSYTEVDMDGQDVIIGQMIESSFLEMVAKQQGKPAPPAIRRVLERDITPAFDGGCAILTLVYDVRAAVSPKIFCNPTGPK